MGLVYTVMLQDDFDFDYIGRTKEDSIAKIKKDFKKHAGYYPEVLGKWYGHIVLDCGKFPIFLEEYRDILQSNCDTAMYWDDSSPFKKTKI